MSKINELEVMSHFPHLRKETYSYISQIATQKIITFNLKVIVGHFEVVTP